MDSGHKSGSKYRLIWVVYECLGMDLRACELWGMCVEHVGHTCTLGGTCRAQAIGLGWALVPKKLFTSKWTCRSFYSPLLHRQDSRETSKFVQNGWIFSNYSRLTTLLG